MDTFSLFDHCVMLPYNTDVRKRCLSFSCGDADLDDFFHNDAEHYAEELMGKTYCWVTEEFSVIILDKDFRIIGETKFPGNKYFYKMSFVGRDGLYISENNLANPDFDEDKLVFACFKLEDLKNKK